MCRILSVNECPQEYNNKNVILIQNKTRMSVSKATGNRERWSDDN